MTIKEVAGFLGYSSEQTESLIDKGLMLPISKRLIKLDATQIGNELDVSDDQFNAFIEQFESEEPGRHPPAAVRRELLVESRHLCGICEEPAPPQFHHMLDWAKLRHHDPAHMLHLCPTCHSRCGNGEIDHLSQDMYKAKLKGRASQGGPIDAQQAAKRAADKGVLEQIFECAPRPLIVRFLERASYERILLPILAPLEALERGVELPTFHLYDKELWKFLRSFLAELREALVISRSIYHCYDNGETATPMSGFGRDQSFYERREEFQRRIFISQHAYSLLHCYVREEYPELDLNRLDQAGLESFRAMQAESQRLIAELQLPNARLADPTGE